MKKKLNLTCLMLLSKLGAVVGNKILRDYVKSSCMECMHQESQIYCSSQKLAALHFINKIIIAQAGEKEEASNSFLQRAGQRCFELLALIGSRQLL